MVGSNGRGQHIGKNASCEVNPRLADEYSIIARRVISLTRSSWVAFGVKRTSTRHVAEPDLWVHALGQRLPRFRERFDESAHAIDE